MGPWAMAGKAERQRGGHLNANGKRAPQVTGQGLPLWRLDRKRRQDTAPDGALRRLKAPGGKHGARIAAFLRGEIQSQGLQIVEDRQARTVEFPKINDLEIAVAA